MLRLLKFSFNGDIHWVFLLQTSKWEIGFTSFVYQCRSVFSEVLNFNNTMIRTRYYLLLWMNFVADLFWLFRSFYLRRSSVESFVERHNQKSIVENCPVHANRKIPVQLYVKIQIVFEPPFGICKWANHLSFLDQS
jgi:hypothetical protein